MRRNRLRGEAPGSEDIYEMEKFEKRMERISQLASIQLHNTIVILGKFDGFHLGHQKLLEKALERKETHARQHPGEEELRVVIFTFDVYPVRVLAKSEEDRDYGSHVSPVRTIQTREERFTDSVPDGVDYIVEFPFNKKTMAMEPEQFVKEVLVDRLGVREIICGKDFRFGKDRKGNVQTLRELGSSYGFEVAVVPKVTIRFDDEIGVNGISGSAPLASDSPQHVQAGNLQHIQPEGQDEKQPGKQQDAIRGENHHVQGEELEISSTLIKEELAKGHMEHVTAMLGRPFYIDGTVQKGKQLGRTIGFPTANLMAPGRKMLPPDGVYAVRVIFLNPCMASGPSYYGITNIGRRPTFDDGDHRTVETFLFDFSGDLYETEIRVEFWHYIRPERKFADVQQLTKQMQADAKEARTYFQKGSHS